MAWKKNNYKAKGFITLVYKDNFLEQRQYDCISERKKTIEAWQKRFKRQWIHCSFLINPEIDTQKINLDGTNIKFKRPLVNQ